MHYVSSLLSLQVIKHCNIIIHVHMYVRTSLLHQSSHCPTQHTHEGEGVTAAPENDSSPSPPPYTLVYVGMYLISVSVSLLHKVCTPVQFA